MIRNIFFDFDGVLVESVNVKTEAFKLLYEGFGEEITKKVEEYHLKNGGVSRFDKIRYYHTEILKIPITEEEISKWADRFSKIALQGVLDANEVFGSKQFLVEESHKFNCWIITGTPTTEIIDIVLKKGWTDYFQGVFGSPENKKYWVEYLLANFDLKPEETVFIGDALTDYEAAKHGGLNFILRRTVENKELFKDYSGIAIDNLVTLSQALDSISQ